MYKVIIVDDEEEIRDGLSELIDWNGLGFQVAAKLQDGRQAIHYLQEHPVDAILTDIKMTFASGIDLARYVHEHKPEVRVVILSGFKEFGLARDAIRYNVAYYLLKPTDLDEVADVFRGIAKSLDEEARKREQALRQSQDVKALRPMLMEQFFVNLLSGVSWADRADELRGHLRQMGLAAVDPASSKVCEMVGEWTAERSADRKAEDKRTISAAITKEKDHVHYTCVHLTDSRFVMIGNALVAMSDHELLKRSEQYFIYIQHTLSALLGISVRLDRLQLHNGLIALLEERRRESDAQAAEEAPPVSEAEEAEDAKAADQEKEHIMIRTAKQYIMDHFETELALKDVARHLGLNPVYFSRLFKQETGENYLDYVTGVRIQKAMDYLKDPRYKVYEIGELIGYRNTKYFHKIFKRQTGMTPSEYRERL